MPDLSSTDPALIEALQKLRDTYGHAGVASTLHRMLEAEPVTIGDLDPPASSRAEPVQTFYADEIVAKAILRGEDPLPTLVFQALGAASTCWENMTGTGVFDDRTAKHVGDEVVSQIRRWAGAL